MLFSQVGCKINGGDEGSLMWRKRLIGLGLASLGIYMCIFFRFTMTRVQNELKIAAKALDLDLVSIEDYTISGKIDKAFY